MAIGVSYDFFMQSCPKELKPYEKAHELQLKMQDEQNWMQGIYVKYAFEVVMSHFGAGLGKKKSDAKYIEKPILQTADLSNNSGLTQEEIDQKEIQKMILYEEQWASMYRKKGLPATKIV